MRLHPALAAPLIVAGMSSAAAQQLASGINDLTLTPVVTGLDNPTAADILPDGRIVVLEYAGAIKVLPAGGGQLIAAGQLPTSIMPIEQGGLSLAVDPMFATSNRLYFYYSLNGSPANNRHRVGYAIMDPITSIVNTATITVILDGLYGPRNHNGGGMEFGPDGHLYIGTGDTGCNCNCPPGQANNYYATCLTNLQGKILRIDRDGNVPADNPLVGTAPVAACGSNPSSCSAGPQRLPSVAMTAPVRTEIYNWGFRNAWRFSWDEQTGYLWIGDVGEVTTEEINVSTGGAQHFGWPFREGSQGQPDTRCSQFTAQSGRCRDPAYSYSHNETPAVGDASVTGGVFSNHCTWPAAYRGKYWYGDHEKGRIWTLTPDGSRLGVVGGSRASIVENVGGVVHFFNGPDASIYFVEIDGGRIQQITPTTPGPCNPDGGVGDTGVTTDTGDAPDTGMISDAEPDGGDLDAGMADTGTIGPDAGDLDAGTSSTADAGTSSTADAGFRDTGTSTKPPPRDSGIHPDVATLPPPGLDADVSEVGPRDPRELPGPVEIVSSCGCSAVPSPDDSSALRAISLLLLGLVRRRR